MPDRFSSTAASLSSPAIHAFPVTPADAVDLPETTRAIYVGAAGTLVLRMQSGQVVTLSGVAAGTLLPLRADRVLATGTSASAIVGLV